MAKTLKNLGSLIKSGTFGFCPVCEKHTIFYKETEWLRDGLKCLICGSIPRHRAIVSVIEDHFPNWRNLKIHESSPCGKSSDKFRKEAKNYLATFYDEKIESGKIKDGRQYENLEKQSFKNDLFDIVITQDVFEHVFNPDLAFEEIARTLKPGGCHVFTLPWYHWQNTIWRAIKKNGKIKQLEKTDLHGTHLVTINWGKDLFDYIFKCSKMTTTAIDISDKNKGIDGKFKEVFISKKG